MKLLAKFKSVKDCMWLKSVILSIKDITDLLLTLYIGVVQLKSYLLTFVYPGDMAEFFTCLYMF
jgi:hypothetical protein